MHDARTVGVYNARVRGRHVRYGGFLYFGHAAGGTVCPNHDMAHPPPLPMHQKRRCRVRVGSQHLCHAWSWPCPWHSDEMHVAQSRSIGSLVAPAAGTWAH